MQKSLKATIEKMSKEQLIDIFERMCNNKETEKRLKLIVAPSTSDIERALKKLDVWSTSYIQNSCNDRMREQMYQEAEPLYAALRYADDRTSAYMIFRMHEILHNNDLQNSAGGDDYYELVGHLLSDLASILKCSPELFSKEEFDKYTGIVELVD